MMIDFYECLRLRRIVRIDVDPRIVDKEMAGSLYDLRKARDSLDIKDFKWASIQAYYSMFHAGKALFFNKGFREKSHSCLLEGLKELYVKNGELVEEYVKDLEDSMLVRMDADYGLTYSEETARSILEKAEGFYNECVRILNQYDYDF